MRLLPVGAVGVPVRTLFFRRLAHVHNLHVKRQRDARQRMIRVDRHLARVNADDGDDALVDVDVHRNPHLDITAVRCSHQMLT